MFSIDTLLSISGFNKIKSEAKGIWKAKQSNIFLEWKGAGVAERDVGTWTDSENVNSPRGAVGGPGQNTRRTSSLTSLALPVSCGRAIINLLNPDL